MLVNDAIDGERIYFPTAESNHIPHVFPYMMALPHVKGKQVVDVCCGTGHGTRLLSEAAAMVVGVDYSQEAIAYCRSRELPNVDYLTMDVEAETDPLDAELITSMQGLEHLDDPKALIQRNLDKEWIVALPNDGDDSNHYHHHKIDETVIKDWFGDEGSLKIYYFDDQANYSNQRFDSFTNYLVYYRP